MKNLLTVIWVMICGSIVISASSPTTEPVRWPETQNDLFIFDRPSPLTDSSVIVNMDSVKYIMHVWKEKTARADSSMSLVHLWEWECQTDSAAKSEIELSSKIDGSPISDYIPIRSKEWNVLVLCHYLVGEWKERIPTNCKYWSEILDKAVAVEDMITKELVIGYLNWIYRNGYYLRYGNEWEEAGIIDAKEDSLERENMEFFKLWDNIQKIYYPNRHYTTYQDTTAR